MSFQKRFCSIIASIALIFTSYPATAAAPAWVENLAHHGTLDGVSPEEQSEIICLALVVYYESRGETAKGQRAVAEVVMNRTRSGRYPSSVCDVMFQRGQFSFVKGRFSPLIPKKSVAWLTALGIAKEVFASPKNNGWLSFCNCKKSGFRIGNHIFY